MGHKNTYAKWFREAAEALDAADRHGSATDEPEGVRVIHMTDTLAKEFAQRLRSAATFLDLFPNHPDAEDA
jgi:outer membrane protein assembly factor BamD (BamD/ComL family)